MPSSTPQRRPRDLWGLAYLEREQLISPADAKAVREAAAEWTAEEVVRRGLLDAVRTQQAFARAARVPIADLGAVEPAALHLVTESVARQHCVLALAAGDRVIRLATSNPLDLNAEQALGFATSRQVEFHYALPGALEHRLEEVYRPERHIERLVAGLGGATVETGDGPASAPATVDPAVEEPTARLVDATIADAVRERASDVYLEPTDQGLTIRYRVDGVLREVMKVPRSTANAVVRRLKVMGKLDVPDATRAQEGRASARVDLKEWELRISSVPVARLGEKISIRLVDQESRSLKLEGMGLWDDELRALGYLLDQREGMILVAGPAGSGRTSTLYAALDRIRAGGVKAASVEDPVEHPLAGVNQVGVNETEGLTLGAALRSVLRERPGAVLLGEIPDAETARAAWQAALSGHLVLSSLTAGEATSTLTRLAELGVEPGAIAAALRGVVAQRLLRKLCPKCSTPSSETSLPAYACPPAQFERTIQIREAKGCAWCSFTGYRGRFAVVEVLTVDGAIAKLVSSRAGTEVMVEAARRFGMVGLWDSGLRRVWAGETTYGEAVRVLGDVQARRSAIREAAPVTAPAAPASPLEPAVADIAPEHPVDSTPLVLVADDDPAMRNLAAAVLISEGFSVREAQDGIAVLEATHRHRPALVLLDMAMPNLDGFGVLGALRQSLSGRSIPIIVVTAHDDPETESRCIELGAEDFIAKPIRPASLIARIRAVLRRVGAPA